MGLEVPNRYLALAPVIVTSPTARCGTTLVQRLLTASSNAFCYGEEVGHHIRTLTGFMIGLIRQFEATGEAADGDFQAALAGALADWRPGLMPPTAVMQRAWVETYYQIPAALAEYGRSIGRPVWGFKGPSYSRDTLKAFLMLMPRARVLYVFRDLREALKSAKARRFVTTDEEVTTFCADWATNLGQALELRADDRVMFVRYEHLVAQREDHVLLLEAFTGAQGIDPATYDVKVNTFEGDERDGHSPTQHIAPAALTAADLAAVESRAGSVMKQFYTTQPDAK